MSDEINTISSPHKDFENIKKVDKNGIEYWTARESMPILGYANWQKAEDVIARAARACLNSSQAVDNHFNRTVKMVEIGSNTVREVKDWKLKFGKLSKKSAEQCQSIYLWKNILKM